ncbi:hypothetical protein DL768_003401 [Monosporascus sp. mg162]|nr:hypothetical protein DL768_003401 [Monosporascus sp. mg162]
MAHWVPAAEPIAAEQWVTKYIPAGCLDVPSHSPGLPPEIWMLAELQAWKFFVRPQDYLPESFRLPAAYQLALFRTSVLQPFLSLWKKEWIQLSFSTISSPDKTGRVRVYILPHDTARSRASNSEDEKLTKIIPKLIALLDYSSESWNGQSHASRQAQPTLFGANLLPADSDTSLLAMFNNVPSPNPDPNAVADLDARESMQWLMESKLTGLQSRLYPYQSESAATMLQREMEPGRIVDPRLRPSLDQAGKPWYYDTVAGLVLREPTYYDAPRGGVLAEEMGTGKTLICLALILATKQEPTKPPEPFVAEVPDRPKKASLLDMAAAATNKHSIAWKPYFEACRTQLGFEYENCINALEKAKNRAFYRIRNETLVESRRRGRKAAQETLPRDVYLSSTTLIITPDNLGAQWKNEIKKHTTGLKVLVMTDMIPIPQVTVLLTYDVIIFSQTRFEWIQKERWNPGGPVRETYCPLEYIRFKRCIIDEGHRLGSHGPSYRSDVMRVIDRLEIAARWVVTGTPSRGLYGVSEGLSTGADSKSDGDSEQPSDTAIQQEREDLQRIGNLAAKYLRVRPWANTKDEAGDTVADWNVYVMNKKQHSKAHDRRDCLKGTLDSLIIRHRLVDVSKMLPPVNEKIVVLDGSFQDKLSLNLFSMMIIFNSVQSERTDVDYFFHPRQRKSLVQLVNNLRQASFFGGVFFSAQDITKSLQTAEEFLEKKAVPISAEDEKVLRQAIDFGRLAISNRLKGVSNQYRALPIYLDNFPGGNGKSWALDDKGENGEPICTEAGLVRALQKYLNPCIDAPTSLKLMVESGRLDSQGKAERFQALAAVTDAAAQSTGHEPQAETLAGRTSLGNDRHAKPKARILTNPKSAVLGGDDAIEADASKVEIAEPLAKTRIISTASAKLSYLIDSIVRYQDEEQIIVFYDNNNTAYYLASVLEILQIQHLIYTRAGLTAARRAQYIATFTENPKFRVLLMDITQAAFGLDMRSASRIYFISPVLNPQVEAQAIGRARRINQQRPVTVETLVLRGSIEELIVNRRRHMTQAEHRRVNSVLDDRPMYEWILNARILSMGEDAPNEDDGLAQTARLETPQYVFGRGFGREVHPDEGLLTTKGSPDSKKKGNVAETKNNSTTTAETSSLRRAPLKLTKGPKRPRSPAPPGDTGADSTGRGENEGDGVASSSRPPKRRARIAWADQEG